VLVAVVTRGRPQLLARALASIAELDPVPGRSLVVVVVDNDPDGTARATVDALAPSLPVAYRHEPRTGIAFARNAALDAAMPGDLLAFVDDDSTVARDWLVRLFDGLERYRADVATGPVDREFPADAPAWARTCRVFAPGQHATGERLDVAYTGNVLLRADAVLATARRFDERFPLLGGEDAAFFQRLAADGATIVWVEEARVTESVHPNRLHRRWVLRRAFRMGFAGVRRARAPQGTRRLRAVVGAAGRLLPASLRLVVVLVWPGRPWLDEAIAAAKLVGRLWALLGGRWAGDYVVVDGDHHVAD
jgi:succinoglycan biosynthesis protein ExoM